MPISVQTSDDISVKYLKCNIAAPPGTGKTFLAATLAEQCPEVLPAAAPVTLGKMLWLLFDNGGLDGFKEAGINVPVIDLSNVPLHELHGAITEARKLIRKRVADGVTDTLVIDTVTSMDKRMLAMYQPQYAGGKYGLYDALLAFHSNFFMDTITLECNVLYLFHYKPVNQSDEQKVKQQAQGLENAALTLDMSGQGAQQYRANGSLSLPLKKVKKMDGTFERFVFPKDQSRDAKTRFACLGEKEPANLRQLLQKIKAAQAR